MHPTSCRISTMLGLTPIGLLQDMGSFTTSGAAGAPHQPAIPPLWQKGCL